MKKSISILVVLMMLLSSVVAMAEAPDMAHSYCNPINLPVVDVRTGANTMSSEINAMDATRINQTLEKEILTVADGRSLVRAASGIAGMQVNSFRTTADIFGYQTSDGTIWLHASGSMQNNDQYGACWSSTDYVNWEYHPMNLCVTAPTFVQIGDKYYLAGNGSPVYVADTPAGPWTSMGKFIMPDGSEKGFSDVNFFLDDDGRLYLSYSIGSPIMGCELDPNQPTKVLTEPIVLWNNDTRNEWERFGSGNQNSLCGYTEGSQIFKYNGVYYLQVATNGTESITYSIGVKKSTEGPLSGYVYQQNNPVGYNVSNYIPAVGHGSFLVDQDNNLILFYTQVIGMEGTFERRIGMDICYVDENDEIILANVTDTPQLAPNRVADPRQGSDLGLASLANIGVRYWASSYAPGHYAFYGSDEIAATWWMPAEDDETPVFASGLNSVYDVYAIQTNWKETGSEFTRDNAVKYTIEYFNMDTNEWTMLVDKSDNTTPMVVEYDVIEGGVRTFALKLTILGTTENVPVGIAGFRVFGENHTIAAEHHLWDIHND